MKIRLITKQKTSQSLKRIAEGLSNALGYKVWRSEHPRTNRINLLYGDCKDKLHQYQWFEANGLPSLPFTTSATEAQNWLHDGYTVLARKFLNSSEGKGIVVCEPNNGIVQAPVFTKYIPKKREYRVHIFKDKIVQILEKRRGQNYTGDSKVRNTANGYVFCQQDITLPAGGAVRLNNLALAASKVTNSDFKGVDIGYNEKKDFLFVIECNSAPGIEGSNVAKYVETIVNETQNI